jgi:hypothetical protein
MRVAPRIELTQEQSATLKQWSRGRKTPTRLVRRSQIVLLAAEGKKNLEIASDLGILAEWTAAAERVGFRMHAASREFLNPWLVEHRYENKVKLFTEEGTTLIPMWFPASNMVLVAEKA